MNIQQTAERIYNEQQTARPAAEKFFGSDGIPAIMKASVEEIAAHIQMVQDVSRQYQVSLDYTKFEFGCSRDTVENKAAAKVKANNRRAGAKALIAKYGYEAACRITGKTLQR